MSLLTHSAVLFLFLANPRLSTGSMCLGRPYSLEDGLNGTKSEYVLLARVVSVCGGDIRRGPHLVELDVDAVWRSRDSVIDERFAVLTNDARFDVGASYLISADGSRVPWVEPCSATLKIDDPRVVYEKLGEPYYIPPNPPPRKPAKARKNR